MAERGHPGARPAPPGAETHTVEIPVLQLVRTELSSLDDSIAFRTLLF